MQGLRKRAYTNGMERYQLLEFSQRFRLLLVTCVLASVTLVNSAAVRADPLPSWQAGETRRAILEFISAISDTGSDSFVPVAERVAVFDNDGTLWAEQPVYAQIHFARDQIRFLASDHPEWVEEEPFATAIRGDIEALARLDKRSLGRLVMAAQSGETLTRFDHTVRTWISTARHPVTGRNYRQMVYEPMLELMDLFRLHDFKLFIVSGGSTSFIRAYAEPVYSIPPEQVIGSSEQLRYEVSQGQPSLTLASGMEHVNDNEGKVLSIARRIGARPIAAFGNSDGDLEMLRWTGAGEGRRLVALVHHTDPLREWAYDRESPVGRLDKGLDLATSEQWTIIDMAQDWVSIFGSGQATSTAHAGSQ